MLFYNQINFQCISIDGSNVLRRAIGLMSRVFANGQGDRGSIPGQVIPKTQKNGT